MLRDATTVDARFQANIACALDSLMAAFSNKPGTKYNLLPRERLHYWFKKMILFGASSTEGYAIDVLPITHPCLL